MNNKLILIQWLTKNNNAFFLSHYSSKIEHQQTKLASADTVRRYISKRLDCLEWIELFVVKSVCLYGNETNAHSHLQIAESLFADNTRGCSNICCSAKVFSSLLQCFLVRWRTIWLASTALLITQKTDTLLIKQMYLYLYAYLWTVFFWYLLSFSILYAFMLF